MRAVDWIGAVHILILFAGVFSFALSFLFGLSHVLLARQLKSKHFGWLARVLPSLEEMDRLAVRLIVAGVILMGLGISTGIFMAHVLWPKEWIHDPKVIFSFVTFAWYIVLLLIRIRMGWRGSRFLTLIVIGFLLLLFTLGGLTFFFNPQEHPFIWTL